MAKGRGVFIIEQLYTRGDEVTLPGDDTNLETFYSDQDITDVATKDDTRVGQTGKDMYMLHQFKDYIGAITRIKLEWEGQTSQDPSVETVYLQIYNRDTTTWDTVDFDNSSAVNTDFILTADISDLTDYKDSNNVISCRVYQSAPGL